MIDATNKTSIDFSNIFSIANSVSSDDQFDTVSILSRYSPLNEKNPRVLNFDFVNTGVTYEYCTRDKRGGPISFSLDTVTGSRQSRSHVDRYYWTGDIKRNKETKQCFFTWSEISGAEFLDDNVDNNETHKTDGVLILPTPGWVYPWGIRFKSHGHRDRYNLDTVGWRLTNGSMDTNYYSPGMYQTWNHRAQVTRDFWASTGGLPMYAGFGGSAGELNPSAGYRVMPGSNTVGIPYVNAKAEDFVGVNNSGTLQHAFKIELNFEDLPPYTWVPLFGFGLNRMGNAVNLSDSLGERMYITNKDGAGTDPKRDGNRVPPAFTHSRNNIYKENTIGNERGLAYCWYKHNAPEKIGTDEYYDHISDPVRCNQADSNLLQYWIYSHDGAGNAMVATCAGELPIQYDYAGRCSEYPRNKMWGTANGLSQWVAPIALSHNKHFIGESGEPSLVKLWRQFGGDGAPREDGKITDNYYSSFRIWHKYHRSDAHSWNIIENCPSLMDTVGYAAVTSDIFVGFEWVGDPDTYVRDPKLEPLPPLAYLTADNMLANDWSKSYYDGKPWPGPHHLMYYGNGDITRWQHAYSYDQVKPRQIQFGWSYRWTDSLIVSEQSRWSLYTHNALAIPFGTRGENSVGAPWGFKPTGGDVELAEHGMPRQASDGLYAGTSPEDDYSYNNNSLNFPDPPDDYCYKHGPWNMKNLLYTSAFHGDPNHAQDKVAGYLESAAHPRYTESWLDNIGLASYNIGQLVSYGPTANADLKERTEIHMNISMVQDDTPVNYAKGEGYSQTSGSQRIYFSDRDREYPQTATKTPTAAIRTGRVQKPEIGGSHNFGPSSLLRGIRRWSESSFTYVATGRIGDFTFRDVPMITSHECHRGTHGGTPFMPALMIRASVVGDCRIHSIDYASYPYTGTRRTITDPVFLDGQISSGYDTELQFFVGGFTWGPVELAKDDPSRIRNAQDNFPDTNQWLNPIGLLDGDTTNKAVIKGVGEENALFVKMNGPLTDRKPDEDAPLSRLNIILREVRQLSLLSYRLTFAIVSEDKQTTYWELPFEQSVNVEVNNSISFPPAGGALNFDVDLAAVGLTYADIKKSWLKLWAIRNV